MPPQPSHSPPSRRWRMAGAVSGAVLAVVFLGCMSLHIGRSYTPCASVGVTTDPLGVVKQEGKVTLGPECSQQVFYPVSYANVPNLEIHEPGCLKTSCLVTHQEKNSFTLQNKDQFFSHTFHWTARGVREAPAAPPIGTGPITPWPPVQAAPTAGPTLPAPKEALPPAPVPVPPDK